ncbi:TPA: hypothetical protein PI096_002623 [Staphylococcus aureus]|nr:hypothetical protein [Staphylococcus aureus]HDH4312410.1 hypothetical protein [Staphylococcus aureus]HDH4315111.1 hypothetical protein [Staphylococcus aureus]HDH4320190.1 hypothetical protein [Staphylococcus aureus]HDH4424190.1 hypothetical protein [Staphylococcus aureus]
MQNPKLDLKSILTIVLIILLAIISFVLVVGYIISSVDPNHSITGYSIAISFVGVFATFGGAYLGAKISGDNARELFEKDIKIRDIEKHFSANLVVLYKINESKKIIVNIKENIEKGKFYKPYDMKAIYKDIKTVYEKFNDIKRENIVSSSLIINMDFDNLYVYTEKLHEQLPFIDIEKTKKMIKKYYEGNISDIPFFCWLQYTPSENWIYITDSTTMGVRKIVETSKVIEDNISIFNDAKNKLEENLIDWLKQYEKMEFKTKDDIYKIYNEVRM